jgi:hypothetical protein
MPHPPIDGSFGPNDLPEPPTGPNAGAGPAAFTHNAEYAACSDESTSGDNDARLNEDGESEQAAEASPSPVPAESEDSSAAQRIGYEAGTLRAQLDAGEDGPARVDTDGKFWGLVAHLRDDMGGEVDDGDLEPRREIMIAPYYDTQRQDWALQSSVANLAEIVLPSVLEEVRDKLDKYDAEIAVDISRYATKLLNSPDAHGGVMTPPGNPDPDDPFPLIASENRVWSTLDGSVMVYAVTNQHAVAQNVGSVVSTCNVPEQWPFTSPTRLTVATTQQIIDLESRELVAICGQAIYFIDDDSCALTSVLLEFRGYEGDQVKEESDPELEKLFLARHNLQNSSLPVPLRDTLRRNLALGSIRALSGAAHAINKDNS